MADHSAAVAYPSSWEADLVLSDGGTVHVRPIRPEDEDRVLRLYERLSAESIYLRFFSPVPAPTARQVERLTEVDYDQHVVVVAQLGEEIVAMARYDRYPSGDTAEVAFVVEDAQQGRGMGTLLLEHLAAIGSANGLTRFVASTLPENRRMLSVFRDAGYEISRRFDGGTVEVEFPIEPTEASRAAQFERERKSEARSVARLLAPSSVAVIGASRRPGTIGHELFRNLLEGQFTGPVYPINPTTASVASVRAYPSVLDVPDDVALAVVVVPAHEVAEVVGQCAAKGVGGLVIISAGFSEVATDRAGAEREIVETARRHGMRLVGPNCMGVINTNAEIRMNATFAPFVPPAGRVGFLSQSGALGIELLGRASEMGLGVSTFVSVGNKADVSGNDLLQYWEDDPDTDVILLYLESFGNPRKFSRLARRISRQKPIIAVKSGRTQAGTRAASSHTAALASPDVAVDALFRQAGVIRVDALEQLFDAAQVLAHQPLPPGNRVAIISNGGGPAILAADACSALGLDVPELSQDVQRTLRSFVNPDAGVANPIDLVASATAETYGRALRTVLADEQVDSVLVIFVPPLVTQAEDVARAIQLAAADAGPKPIVACFLSQHGVPDALRSSGAGHRSIPSFAFPESAAAALARAAHYAEWRRRPEGHLPRFDDLDVERARAIVAAQLALHPDGAWLDPVVAGDLCRCFGIPVATSRPVADAGAAEAAAEELGYPVALKAGSGSIVHKTDVGGVHLDLRDAAQVRDAFVAMHGALGDEMGGAVVQRMIEPGIETIVGVTHDPLFGSLVMLGMGGLAAELIRDTTLRILPMTDLDAHEMVRSLRSSPLLFGYRGTRRADVDALERLLLRVALLADELPEVAEMDCNPVIVSPNDTTAVDVKIRVAPLPPSPLSGVRRMR